MFVTGLEKKNPNQNDKHHLPPPQQNKGILGCCNVLMLFSLLNTREKQQTKYGKESSVI